MNFLYFANRSGYPKEKIDKILDEIFKVIINHIATEETLMEKVGGYAPIFWTLIMLHFDFLMSSYPLF